MGLVYGWTWNRNTIWECVTVKEGYIAPRRLHTEWMNGYDGGNVHDVGDYYYYYGDAGAAWLLVGWVACLGSNTLPLHHLFIIVYMCTCSSSAVDMATPANPNPPTNLLAKGSHYTFNWGALEEHFDNDNRVCMYVPEEHKQQQPGRERVHVVLNTFINLLTQLIRQGI